MAKLRQAISVAIKRADSNSRIAIPQYFWDKNATHGELQLLLPLEMDSIGIRCAATVRVAPSGKYEFRSILSLQQSYMNARLVSKVEQQWLQKAF